MSEKSKHKEKLNYLDIARGIGIVVVILAHVDTGDNPLCSWIGSFCMAIFFFVSGALLNYLDRWRGEGFFSIILKRIKGVMYPYFAFSLLIILYYTFMRVVFKQGSFSNILEIIKSTVSLSGYDALWFMPTLFFAEVICVLMLRYFGRNDKQTDKITGEWISFGVVFVLSLICYCILHYGIIEEYADGWFLFVKFTRVLMSAVFIFAGYFYFEYKSLLFKINKKIMVTICIIWLIIDFPIAQPNHFVDYAFVRIVSLPLQYLTGILTSASILYLGEALNIKCKVLEFFGRNSLTMMATHNPLPVLAFVYEKYIKYVPRINRYADDIIILIIVLILEIPIVMFVNRFLPFIVRWPNKKAGR
ncbi:MAG: acyltransferase family protein [Lachnospiraceae bacterium]|nr:acyltransferase family protein [Lachnospiraceae bacterium]